MWVTAQLSWRYIEVGGPHAVTLKKVLDLVQIAVAAKIPSHHTNFPSLIVLVFDQEDEADFRGFPNKNLCRV